MQHYTVGTQENYNSFSSKIPVMEKGNELKFPKGGRGAGGLEILRISEEPLVPPKNMYSIKIHKRNVPLNIDTKKMDQHYPLGTQENNNSFESRNLMMEKGKELECTRRAGGGKGSGIRFADSNDRGFPLIHSTM
jgi:hypothetical protein